MNIQGINRASRERSPVYRSVHTVTVHIKYTLYIMMMSAGVQPGTGAQSDTTPQEVPRWEGILSGLYTLYTFCTVLYVCTLSSNCVPVDSHPSGSTATRSPPGLRSSLMPSTTVQQKIVSQTMKYFQEYFSKYFLLQTRTTTPCWPTLQTTGVWTSWHSWDSPRARPNSGWALTPGLYTLYTLYFVHTVHIVLCTYCTHCIVRSFWSEESVEMAQRQWMSSTGDVVTEIKWRDLQPINDTNLQCVYLDIDTR